MSGHGHLGNLALIVWRCSDGLAEGDAVVGASKAISSMRWHMPRLEARVQRETERVDGDFHALALFTKQVLLVELHVGELEAGVPSAAAPIIWGIG